MSHLQPPVLLLALVACGGPPPEPTLSLSPTDPTTVDALELAVADGPGIEADDLVEYTIVWLRDEAEVADLADATTVPSARTRKGEAWTARVTAVDDKERVSLPVEAGVTIANTAPTATVTLAPDAPPTTRDLVATAEAADPDGDAITWSWAWTRDGSSTSYDGDTVPASATRRGQVWQVRATPSDGEVEGAAATAEVTIVNTPPTAPVVEIVPSDANDQQDLVCRIATAAVDADDDELAYDIDWFVDGSLWTGSTSTTMVEGDTILAANTAADQAWSCIVSAWDGEDFGPDAESDAVTVVASFTPPVVGSTGTFGVNSGDPWKVCRADEASAWIASNKVGEYRIDDICRTLGYDEVDDWGGHCGTVCGYCGTAGDETYDRSTGCSPPETHCSTVHWRCAR